MKAQDPEVAGMGTVALSVVVGLFRTGRPPMMRARVRAVVAEAFAMRGLTFDGGLFDQAVDQLVEGEVLENNGDDQDLVLGVMFRRPGLAHDAGNPRHGVGSLGHGAVAACNDSCNNGQCRADLSHPRCGPGCTALVVWDATGAAWRPDTANLQPPTLALVEWTQAKGDAFLAELELQGDHR